MNNIIFAEKDLIILIHDDQINRYGGNLGFLNENLLDSAIGAVKQTYGGNFLNKFPHEMASTYMFSICKNHAFLDGNKRTAVSTLLTFLDMNNYTLNLSESELYNISIKVAEGSMKKDQLSKIILENI